MNVFYVVGFYYFFLQLEVFNEINNQLGEVPESDQVMTDLYVVSSLTLYMIAPLFQGLSFCAYTMELATFYESKWVSDYYGILYPTQYLVKH